VLAANLLASPCLQPATGHQLIEVYGCSSAAQGFEQGITLARHDIVVWVHQDVFLPEGWDRHFVTGFVAARRMGAEMVGVYGLGVAGADGILSPVGEVVDRGRLLCGTSRQGPQRASSMDELLFAVPRTTALRLDPELGFDLYATDLILQLEARGGWAAVVWASCEHRSALPLDSIPPELLPRFHRAARVFERKWAHRFPLETLCGRFSREEPISDWLQSLMDQR
jgi:hypothetical protein